VRRPLALLAVAAWVVSFALPTIDMAGRGDAHGVVAALYALWVAPTVGILIDGRSIRGPDLPFALLMATYFPALAIANLVVPLSLVPHFGLARARVVVAILASGVPRVPWPDLWRVLELTFGERVRLEVGYFVWLLSFWLLVIASARVPRWESSRPGS
jgi:hypothetical protein